MNAVEDDCLAHLVPEDNTGQEREILIEQGHP